MDRQHRMEQLPAEPPEGETTVAVFMLTVALPSGRKLTRRWYATDRISAVAEFAFGSAEEEELPYAHGPPILVCNFPRRELGPSDVRSLAEVGLATREVLRAVVADKTG